MEDLYCTVICIHGAELREGGSIILLSRLSEGLGEAYTKAAADAVNKPFKKVA
jgi:hypothetical protein